MTELTIDIGVNLSMCDALPVVQQVAAQVLISGPCLLVGYSLHNTSTTNPDVIRLTDGNTLLAPMRIANPVSTANGPSLPGIRIKSGITMTQSNGTTEGSIYVIRL